MQTFVVRVWPQQPETGEGPDALRGVVEHIATGRSERFRDDAELLAFLHLRPWARERELEVGRGDGGAP